MSNYPPGTSAGDPRAPWNAPDRSHEHEWYPTDEPNPILEDGAAIFHDYCEFTEGRWNEGWSCEETRSFRCELDRVILERENAPDVTYLAETAQTPELWSYVHTLFEDALIAVENGARNGGDELHFQHIDPANEYGDGYVEVSVGKYTVIYTQ